MTLIESGTRVLAREEPFAAEAVTTALRDHGVEVLTGVQATRVRRGHAPAAGEVTLMFDELTLLEADEHD